MIGGLGVPETVVLLLIGLFVFGPERLPTLAAEAGRALRKVRTYLQGMGEDLKAELGPEVGDLDLRSLHPREFVRKHLFEDDPADLQPTRRALLLPGEPVPWDPDTT